MENWDQKYDRKVEVQPLGRFFKQVQSDMEQQDTIRRFKGSNLLPGEKEINILVATSVIEEGLDVTNCNVVISYNITKSLRAFIQIKGRARREDSKYIVLVPEIIVSLSNQYDRQTFLLGRREKKGY